MQIESTAIHGDDAGLSEEKLVELYRGLYKVRNFEAEAVARFKSGVMPGFIHAYLGEESVAVGACATLRPDDCISSTHRGHGHCIAKGAKLDRMMAELYGRETGYCHGRGGSMHIADFSLGILGANGVVAAGMPIAVGAALAFKLRKEDRVVISFFGDGATNNGGFHESLNLASVWKLPVVFVCENNFYAISVPQKDHQNIQDISVRASSYGIPGVRVDGNDVVAVYEATNEAVKRARSGLGPSLVVCDTYRHEGHFVGDPKPYRTKAEEEEWRGRDPVFRFRDALIRQGVLAEEKVAALEGEIDAEIAEAVKFAESSPRCDPEDATRFVYYEPGDGPA